MNKVILIVLLLIYASAMAYVIREQIKAHSTFDSILFSLANMSKQVSQMMNFADDIDTLRKDFEDYKKKNELSDEQKDEMRELELAREKLFNDGLANIMNYSAMHDNRENE